MKESRDDERRQRAPLPPLLDWSGASEALIAKPDDPWITPAEASGFDETPDLATTMSWLTRLAAASPFIRMESFGLSCEGRALPLVIASRDPETVFGGPRVRARLLVQCGIHPGEIDGKDAGLMLLRDIALRGKDDLLEGVDWLFVPVLNVDGHERRFAFSRPNQRGPNVQGWRTNAQNLNLNRDYMKADSPEIAALLALLTRADPDLYIDLHVTDGLDYQYDITYGFQESAYAKSPHCSAWLESRYRSAVDGALLQLGHCPGPLILARDERKPDTGLYLPAFPPRFSHAYGDCRHIPTVLVENHSLKPVRRRVLGTYGLLEASLTLLAHEAPSLSASRSADRDQRRETLVTRWKDAAAPVRRQPFLSIAHETYRSIASGQEEVRWLGRPLPPCELPLYGSEADVVIETPQAYWIPAGEAEAIERLCRHGIVMETTPQPLMLELEMMRFGAIRLGTALSQRRPVLEALEIRTFREWRRFGAGSVRIPYDQPLGTLAAMLLEPSSPDSLFANGIIAGMADRTEYLEAYVVAPMADRMLEEDPELRRAFEHRLSSDPVFSTDPQARLSWFYERSPYCDPDYLLYPIGKIP